MAIFSPKFDTLTQYLVLKRTIKHPVTSTAAKHICAQVPTVTARNRTLRVAKVTPVPVGFRAPMPSGFCIGILWSEHQSATNA